ncbi:LPXTG cell wall anchor domain-containing protein [Parenemella sanctibonifatiensis]|uniref:Gram-positive cocci surface proteins LPxTG domain-containing protein n=1 Tax=Parenemella sanctibonifatiensis TaxID=2016505 RepID=A0A255EGC3_9ACTN|nr:LPXTG cell wall anchor domain-containing protein [Parenemella sanctibonifatiensis]OYN90310.1 hypothetical protein CGZ91_09130 [Parenemella sanctibonifatiensis]
MTSHHPLRTAGLVAASFGLTLALLPGSAHAQDIPEATSEIALTNHSFEENLTGWSSTTIDGTPAADCSGASSITTDQSTEGANSLRLEATGDCATPTVASDPQPLNEGDDFTAFADVVETDGVTELRLQWLAGEEPVGVSEPGRVDAEGLLVVRADRPAGADGVRVLITGTAATVDQVLVSAAGTVTEPQVTKNAQYFSMDAGFDEDGRAVVFTVGTGSATSPAILTVVDIVTQEITQTVEMPGLTGSWGIRQNPVTGTVYVAGYGAPALWLWTPGEAEAVNVGAPPMEHVGFLYDVDFDEDGIAYGSTWGEPTAGWSGAKMYSYVEEGLDVDQAPGFHEFGDQPLTSDAAYARPLTYENTTRTVFTGTGTGPGTAHLFGCSIDDDTDCVDLAEHSDFMRDQNWVYGVEARDGYVIAWTGPGNSSTDRLVILKVGRDGDGALVAENIGEIGPVWYNGSSKPTDGKIYYNKNVEDRRIIELDLAALDALDLSGDDIDNQELIAQAERETPAETPGIASRRWDTIEIPDPEWPGQTVVGLNAGGYLVRYNLETEAYGQFLVENQPQVSTRINSITVGPDDNIYTSGYLVGGTGAQAPMRPDHSTYVVGGQNEEMISHDGAIYVGRYPTGNIERFAPEDLQSTPAVAPQVVCEVGHDQDRPYGLLAVDDRLYFGTQAGGGGSAGAFGWLDLSTEECTVLEAPIGAQSVNDLTAAGGKIFGAGNIYFGYTHQPTEDQAILLVFDPATEEVRELTPIEGARAISAVTTDAQGLLWLWGHGQLVVMDPVSEEVLQRFDLPWGDGDGLIGGQRGELIQAADGLIYANLAGHLISFDPEAAAAGNFELTEIATPRSVGWRLDIDRWGNLWTDSDTRLVRIVTAQTSAVAAGEPTPTPSPTEPGPTEPSPTEPSPTTPADPSPTAPTASPTRLPETGEMTGLGSVLGIGALLAAAAAYVGLRRH